MLNCENHYINLVVLGNFNPSILTHEFLVKECHFDLPKEPKKATLPPVQTLIDYGPLVFFADLGRFEIKENHCLNPKASKITEYLKTYLGKLPHTPLNKCGANFSCGIDCDEHRVREIGNWLKNDRNKLREILKLNSVTLEITFLNSSEDESISNWTLRTQLKEFSATTMMRANVVKNQRVNLDFNYEVDHLEKDRNLIRSIIDQYTNVVDLFTTQIDGIFGK